MEKSFRISNSLNILVAFLICQNPETATICVQVGTVAVAEHC